MIYVRSILFVLLTLGVGQAAFAATVSYGLNVNNIGLDSSIDYATVTISDDEEDYVAAGEIQFDIVINDEFVPGGNFGLQNFYFNTALGLSGVLVNGMAGWQLRERNTGYNASEFGRFDAQYRGRGNSRTDMLSFSLANIDGDTLLDYALANADGFLFAAHIAGFEGDGNSSGWFSNSISPVPLPAGVWLFGSALLGLIAVSRRSKQHNTE
jgi:hypothetical protein